MPELDDTQSPDLIRTISRHSLSYVLCSISELFRHYDFDPIDLLIIHATLNANMLNLVKGPELASRSGSMDPAAPGDIAKGLSRGALSRFLSIPMETIRRRVDRLKKQGILSESRNGLIIAEQNRLTFGDNHELQKTNVALVQKLLRELRRSGIEGPDDL